MGLDISISKSTYKGRNDKGNEVYENEVIVDLRNTWNFYNKLSKGIDINNTEKEYSGEELYNAAINFSVKDDDEELEVLEALIEAKVLNTDHEFYKVYISW